MESRELTADELNHVSGGTLPSVGGSGLGISFTVAAGGASISWQDPDGGTWTMVSGVKGVSYVHD